MKLLLINPNTSLPMTAAIAKRAHVVAATTTEIVAVQPCFGPLSIESHYDKVFAVAVKFAEALAALNLSTSKRGDYAQPLPETHTGWAAPLGWPK